MKRAWILILVFLILAGSSFAAEKPKKTPAKKTKAAASEVAPALSAAPQLSAGELAYKTMTALNKKEWPITFVPIGNAKARPQTDTLTFYGSKVSSKRFSAKGFAESYYTLRVLPDGSVTWETVQKNDKDEVVFWKGELQGDIITGVLSFQPKKGGNEDFSFSTAYPKP